MVQVQPVPIEGTLVRLIPLDVQWEGNTAKYRVETGDVGKVLGTLQYEPTKGWMAYGCFEDPYKAETIVGSPWTDPMQAVLALFEEYVEHVLAQPKV